jgi:hypothetical protein
MAQLDPLMVDLLIAFLCQKFRMALYGVSPEGLTMHLHHLSPNAHPLGDMTTLALFRDDCIGQRWCCSLHVNWGPILVCKRSLSARNG